MYSTHRSNSQALVAPLLIGRHNCEAVTGLPWRTARDWAHAHGVPVLGVGRRSVIVAATLLAALERHGAPAVPEQPRPVPRATGDVATIDDVWAQLGLNS